MIEFLKGSITPKDWMANAGILGVTVLLCIVFGFFIRGPQQEKLAKLNTDIKKQQEDISKAHKFAVEKFAGDLLAVKDTLEMALADQNPDSLRSGVEMTLKNLVSAFEKAAIVEVNPVGEKFDPHKHQAMAMVDAEQPANTVVQVFQKGYLIADRTLRPAMVAVAKPKDA